MDSLIIGQSCAIEEVARQGSQGARAYIFPTKAPRKLSLEVGFLSCPTPCSTRFGLRCTPESVTRAPRSWNISHGPMSLNLLYKSMPKLPDPSSGVKVNLMFGLHYCITDSRIFSKRNQKNHGVTVSLSTYGLLGGIYLSIQKDRNIRQPLALTIQIFKPIPSTQYYSLIFHYCKLA